MKQIKIDAELFNRLCAFFLLDKRDNLQEQIIKNALQDKLGRMQMHDNYIPTKIINSHVNNIHEHERSNN